MNQAVFETIWGEPHEDGKITIRSKKASPSPSL
jgi:hypothetical protein